jgi:hypothetical protein
MTQPQAAIISDDAISSHGGLLPKVACNGATDLGMSCLIS